MKNIKYVCFCLLLVFMIGLMSGCGSNYMAKHFGGTVTIDLEENKKLVEVTWKEDSLWILTKPMLETDIAETYEFKQDSNFGVFEGTVILVENSSKD